MYQLTKAAYLCLKNRSVRHKIADACQVRESTVYYWINNDSPNLIRLDVLDVISQETGLSIDELATKELETIS